MLIIICEIIQVGMKKSGPHDKKPCDTVIKYSAFFVCLIFVFVFLLSKFIKSFHAL